MDADAIKILKSARDMDEMLLRVRELIPTKGPRLKLLVNNTHITRTFAVQVKQGRSAAPRVKTLVALVEHFAPGYTLGLISKQTTAGSPEQALSVDKEKALRV